MDKSSQVNLDYYSKLYTAFGRKKVVEIVLRSLLIKRQLKNITSVLDVGCGTGTLLDMLDCRQKIGIDIIPPNKNYKIIVQDLNEKPKLLFSDNSFEVVILSHILEHLNTWKAVLVESFRVLKKGGMLVIAVPINEAHPAHATGFSFTGLLRFLEASSIPFSYQKNLYLWGIPPRFERTGMKSLILRVINNLLVRSHATIAFLDNVSRLTGERPKQVLLQVTKQ